MIEIDTDLLEKLRHRTTVQDVLDYDSPSHFIRLRAQFVDDFRHADADQRLVQLEKPNRYLANSYEAASIAATVDALCDEVLMNRPAWTSHADFSIADGVDECRRFDSHLRDAELLKLYIVNNLHRVYLEHGVYSDGSELERV